MSASFLAAAASRASDAAHSPAEPLVNALMLVKWPQRQEMIQHAIASFLCQDYSNRVLTVVNDGEPCQLSAAFFAHSNPASGTVVQAPAGCSIGEKRNLGAAAVPAASYVASFDDDDFSLPGRLRTHVAAIGDAVWLSASRKFISIGSLTNIIGYEDGRCYGAGMISTRITRELQWPPMSYCEDQKLFEAVRAHPTFGSLTVEDASLLYVHRRHETNASAAHRSSLWQGVLPLQLAGREAVGGAELVRSLVGESSGKSYLEASVIPAPA